MPWQWQGYTHRAVARTRIAGMYQKYNRRLGLPNDCRRLTRATGAGAAGTARGRLDLGGCAGVRSRLRGRGGGAGQACLGAF